MTVDRYRPHECRAVLAEFAAICPRFETLDWVVVFGAPFWMRGQLSVIRHDLDGDGRDDLIVRVEHVGHCGTAGCSNEFLFGGESLAENVRPFTVRSMEDIRLVERDGWPGVIFGDAGKFFPVSMLRPTTQLPRGTSGGQ